MERIERWYRQLGLERGWDRERFERLCRQLGGPAEELAAMVGLKQYELLRCLKQNRFSKPVSILLALTDQWLVRFESGNIGPPIMPVHELTLKPASTTGSKARSTPSPSTSAVAALVKSEPIPPNAGCAAASPSSRLSP